MSVSIATPLDHSMNLKNKELFIKHTADDIKDIMQKFFEITIHVSHDEFMQKISTNIQIIKANMKENTNIYVYIDTTLKDYIHGLDYKHKSNYWVYLYIEMLLKQQYNIDITLIHSLDIINEEDIVILCDDCLYTGTQISNTIHNLKTTKKVKFSLIIFAPYMSQTAQQIIVNAIEYNNNIKNCNLIFISYQIIYPLKHWFTLEDVRKLFAYYADVDIYSQLNKYPIYFDHKIADELSSFPLIYYGYVPNDNNKNINIEQKKIYSDRTLSWNEKQDKIANLEKNYSIFPILKNCEHINKPYYDFLSESQSNTECPFPPYKQTTGGKSKKRSYTLKTNRQNNKTQATKIKPKLASK